MQTIAQYGNLAGGIHFSCCAGMVFRYMSCQRRIWMRARSTAIVLVCCLAGVSLFAQKAPRVVHVFVALADNQNQGIVPVPAALGNGLDANRNLYWGSAGGVKTYFRRAAEWKLLTSGQGPKAEILERCVFKHRTENVYLVAD